RLARVESRFAAARGVTRAAACPSAGSELIRVSAPGASSSAVASEPAAAISPGDRLLIGVGAGAGTTVAVSCGTPRPHHFSRSAEAMSAWVMLAAVLWLFMEKTMCSAEAKWAGCSDQSLRPVRRHSRMLAHPDIENITADNRSSHHWRRSIGPFPPAIEPGPKWAVVRHKCKARTTT